MIKFKHLMIWANLHKKLIIKMNKKVTFKININFKSKILLLISLIDLILKNNKN